MQDWADIINSRGKLVRFISVLILSIMLSVTCLAEVPDRVYNMKNLELHFTELKSSKDKYQALNALFKMNNAVLDLIEFLPEPLSQLGEDDPKVVEYRSTLNMLLDEINKAKKLFVAGEFKEGKKSVKKIEQIKKIGHKKFK